MEEIISYVEFHFMELRGEGLRSEASRLVTVRQKASKRGSRFYDEPDSHVVG